MSHNIEKRINADLYQKVDLIKMPSSHSSSEDDVLLSKTNDFAKMLSQQIALQFEISDTPPAPKRQMLSKKNSKLFLLKGFDTPIVISKTTQTSKTHDVHTKPAIIPKRRDDNDYSLTTSEKIRLAVTSMDAISRETCRWRERCRDNSHLYRYKSKKLTLYLIEPKNEFTERRNQYNWSESKIARTKVGDKNRSLETGALL